MRGATSADAHAAVRETARCRADRAALPGRRRSRAFAICTIPHGSFEVKSRDVEYRREGSRSWLARVYQPQGPGPFPALMEVHGGAWNNNDRLQNEPLNQAVAASGIVVVAIDFRQGEDGRYPASIADVNYATRWLKQHAGDFNAVGRGDRLDRLLQRRPHQHAQRDEAARPALRRRPAGRSARTWTPAWRTSSWPGRSSTRSPATATPRASGARGWSRTITATGATRRR